MAAGFKTRAEALYESAVGEIRSAGVELAPMDYARLWTASREAVETGRDGPPSLLSPDVIVAGSVVLHAPTVGCLLWWEEYGKPAFDGVEREEVIGLAWMLAHAGEEERFRKTTSRAAVLRAVKWWAWRLPWHVTPADLAWGVSAVLGSPDVPPTARVEVEASSADWGELVAGVAHEYKRPPAEIAWKMPVAQVCELARVAKKRRSSGDGARLPTAAYVRLRKYVQELKAGGGHG